MAVSLAVEAEGHLLAAVAEHVEQWRSALAAETANAEAGVDTALADLRAALRLRRAAEEDDWWVEAVLSGRPQGVAGHLDSAIEGTVAKVRAALGPRPSTIATHTVDARALRVS